jgi:hypothetical protein
LSAVGETWAQKVDTSQFPIPVAKALPRARICMGIISDMYTQLMGPKDKEKMTETEKMKKTPAMDRLLFLSFAMMTLSSSRVI